MTGLKRFVRDHVGLTAAAAFVAVLLIVGATVSALAETTERAEMRQVEIAGDDFTAFGSIAAGASFGNAQAACVARARTC